MTRFHSASIVSTTVSKETPYVVKTQTGNKIRDWIFDKLWTVFSKWGHISPFVDRVEIRTFDFTESKKQKVTDRIMEEINKRQMYFNESFDASNYVVIMGEETFFDMMGEKSMDSPFFAHDVSFMSNDVYYNDPYRGRRVYNFSCHVVRGMEGFAIVPKVLIEKRV